MSEIAEVPTKRSNGIASTSSAHPAAAPIASQLGRGAPRSTHASSDDQEQRRDDEDVPLLDPDGELRREGGDDEHEPERDRDGPGQERLQPRLEALAPVPSRTTVAASGTTPR